MCHPRILIRDAIKARLDQNLFSVDSRLTPSRIHLMKMTPLFVGKLPAVLIYSKQERIDDMPGEHQGNRYRKLTMAVEVVTSGESAANEADVIAWAIEQQLEADETLSHLIEAIRLTNTDVEFDSEGDTPVMAVRLNFEVRYWSSDPRPSDAIYHGKPEQVLADRDRVNGMIAIIEQVDTKARAQKLWQDYQQLQQLNDQKEWIENQLIDALSVGFTHAQPVRVLASWSPDIGIPNEPKYQPMREDDGWY
ncbi:MAG TPA: hypothetical protein PLU46_00280 [Thiotrichales bacterium]|nr:hypothetical protein [Thiotrichales bacterium]